MGGGGGRILPVSLESDHLRGGSLKIAPVMIVREPSGGWEVGCPPPSRGAPQVGLKHSEALSSWALKNPFP